MALTVGTKQTFDLAKPSPQMSTAGHKKVLVKLTFDSSYAHGGESLTPTNCGLSEIYDVIIPNQEGYAFEWDATNSKIIVYNGKVSPPVTINDDDSAATTGTALHVGSTADADNLTTYLKSVTANNADAVCRFGEDSIGPLLVVDDDDSAASNGTDLYYDESEGKFLTVHALNHDTVVHLSDGSGITIFDDNSAATNGVAVYFDDNGTNDYERLFMVTTGDADLTFRVNEVPGSSDLSGLVVNAIVMGN
jgi:hypothetical protein